MASEAELAELVQAGHDLTAFKTYAISVTALFIYDYFLTLNDEIHYAWKTESILIFVLFLLTRYLPVLFQVWVVVTMSYPGYTSSEACGKTAFIQVMYYTFIAAFAQIVLTQRAYAITGKNKWVASVLYTICVVQFGVGVYMFIWAILNPAVTLGIPLDSYRVCLAKTTKTFTVIQMALSLAFDMAVFTLVVVQTRFLKSMHRGVNVPSIIDTVSRDAEIYFAVITTTHFLIVVMYAAARPGVGSIPIVGNAVFIPMMISRMIISLKKVASSQRLPHMSLETPGGLSIDSQDTHSPYTAGAIRLSVLRK